MADYVPGFLSPEDALQLDDFLALEQDVQQGAPAVVDEARPVVVSIPDRSQPDTPFPDGQRRKVRRKIHTVMSEPPKDAPPPATNDALPRGVIVENYGPGRGPFNGDITAAREAVVPVPPGTALPVTPGLAKTLDLPPGLPPEIRQQIYDVQRKTAAVRTARAHLLALLESTQQESEELSQKRAAFDAELEERRRRVKSELDSRRVEITKARRDFESRRESVARRQQEECARRDLSARLGVQLSQARLDMKNALGELDSKIDRLSSDLAAAKENLEREKTAAATEKTDIIEQQAALDRRVRKLGQKAEDLRTDVALLRQRMNS